MFFYVFFENSIFQDYPFKFTPDWTIRSSKFQKLYEEGLTEPLFRPLPRSFSGFALDSEPQFLKRGCAIDRLTGRSIYLSLNHLAAWATEILFL